MTHKCNFCGSILSSEYSLLTHQKNAKKCLIKQGIVLKGDFNCELCQETFTLNSILTTHTVCCSKKNNTELKNKNCLLESNLLEFETKYNILLSKYNMILEEKNDWKEEKEKLLDKITTAALSKTNTVKNKNINITYTRTDEELKTIYADNLTSLHIEGGISAIAKLIVDKVVTDVNGIKMITITDKARGTARYKLPSGEDIVDNGLNIFTTKNRDILMKRIYSITAGDRSISDQILNLDTTISRGYTEISDDTEGCILRSSLIKSI
jgi:hypothetical protein